MSEIGCVTGRFQPVHHQHMELFDIALARCEHLIIAVTNPDSGARHQEASSAHRHTAQANPFTYFERARMLGAALAEPVSAGRVTIVPFDLTRPAHWHHYAPAGAQHFVRAYSAWERQKAGWFAEAGYPVTMLDGDPATKVCATDIRHALQAGDDSWREQVPAAAVPVVLDTLARTPLQDRR
ncbi:MAG: hypothetical protein QOI28_3938 [Mycobacterium sp.]|nr:hypothetical protein [Mycobacterium sp.]